MVFQHLRVRATGAVQKMFKVNGTVVSRSSRHPTGGPLCHTMRTHAGVAFASSEQFAPAWVSDQIEYDNIIYMPSEPQQEANIWNTSSETEMKQTEKVLAWTDPAREPMIVPEYALSPSEDVIASASYKIDCSKYDMEADEMPKELVDLMKQKYAESGLVLLTNTGLTEMAKIKRWTSVIINEDESDYSGGANSRGPISTNVYDTGAPKDAHLHYHHEMVYLARSVSSVAFCCSKATRGKGYMYVSDGVAVTKDVLQTQLGQKLKEKGVCYIRCLTDREAYKGRSKGWNGLDESGVYNHWQRSFGVETTEEVEKIANSRGLQVEWGPNRYCKTKYYADAFEYFPKLDMNIFYTSVADDSIWFDTWPGVKELPTMGRFEDATMHERPLKMTYGDDTEFTREELEEFIAVYDRHGIPLKWEVGDMAVMCNFHWAHGRPSYELNEGEERELGVVLGPHFDRVGQNNAAW